MRIVFEATDNAYINTEIDLQDRCINIPSVGDAVELSRISIIGKITGVYWDIDALTVYVFFDILAEKDEYYRIKQMSLTKTLSTTFEQIQGL